MFAFLLTISEVILYVVLQQFCWNDEEIPTYLNFCHTLAWELVDNNFINSEIERQKEVQRRLRNQHNILLVPKHANGWDERSWIKKSKIAVPTIHLQGCERKKCAQSNNKSQTYCTCAPRKWMFKACHLEHICLIER